MSLMRLNRANIAQHRQYSPAQARASLPTVSSGAKYLSSRLFHQPQVQGRAEIRNGAKLISCQASPYDLDPSIAPLQYQPIELPAPSVRTYDFLVLGSGIAGLTYALKVCLIQADTARAGCCMLASLVLCLMCVLSAACCALFLHLEHFPLQLAFPFYCISHCRNLVPKPLCRTLIAGMLF